MLAVVLALGAAVSYGVGDFFGGLSSRRAHVLTVLCAYRLIAPGSEWRLHREWFQKSAMADLLGEDFALAAKDTLYRCLDKLLEHKEALFGFLKARWQGLFGITYEVLLYDLTHLF